MILLDANILVSCIVGVGVKRVVALALEKGLSLAITDAQLLEAVRVLETKFAMTAPELEIALEGAARSISIIKADSYASDELAARARLHARAQPDWPTLAAALATDGAIWTSDRDFFGVGVPVWSTRNMAYAT